MISFWKNIFKTFQNYYNDGRSDKYIADLAQFPNSLKYAC